MGEPKVSDELQALRAVATSVIHTSDFDLYLNRDPVSCTDCERFISVSDRNIPANLRRLPRLRVRYLDALAAHEAGHWVLTRPCKGLEERWARSTLRRWVVNVIEDVRVANFITARYRYDFGLRLRELDEIVIRAWISHLRRTKSVNPLALFTYRVFAGRPIPDWLLGKCDPKRLAKRNRALLSKDAGEVAELAAEARRTRLPSRVLGLIVRTHAIISNWTPARVDLSLIPVRFGGELDVTATPADAKRARAEEGKLKREEECSATGLAKTGKKQQLTAAGTGTGLELPAPEPDEQGYCNLVERARPQIEELLRLLRRRHAFELIPQRWQNSGRLQTEIIGKAYASSLRRDVNHIHERRRHVLRERPVYMGVLVDLSGSMDTREAQLALTTMLEVCGRWLKDEQFAALVFGSDFAKLKVFAEPYATTRFRIGGAHDMGGTVATPPLEAYERIYQRLPADKPRYLVLVTDFEFSDPEKAREALKRIHKLGTQLIGLDYGGGLGREFVTKVRGIGGIADVPRAFVELFEEESRLR